MRTTHDTDEIGSFLPPQFNSRRIFIGGAALVIVIAVLALSGSILEHLDADELMVIQSPLSGTLNWYTDQGVKWQWFGKVTKYSKRFQYWFSADKTEGGTEDQSITARFNDNGHGNISGSISILMPLDEKNLNLIHKAYGSADAVKTQLVRPVIEKSVYMTGPLMSSRESASEKRNYLIQYIEDQIQNGVYQTYTEDIKQPDPITGEMKTVSVVKLRTDANNQLVRQDKSPLNDFGIKTYNLSIKGITYEKQVEAQMQQQQVSIMQVQTAIAKAKQAEQDAITAQKNGEAEAAKAKWDQEVIKAKEVTAAQQRFEVASKDALAAEQTKRKLVLEGEGEASKRQLIMNADGALDKKLDAYVTTQKIWAEAFKDFKGQLVPSVVMGGSQGGSSAPAGGVTQFMDVLAVKAARDLALDLEASGAGKTKK